MTSVTALELEIELEIERVNLHRFTHLIRTIRELFVISDSFKALDPLEANRNMSFCCGKMRNCALLWNSLSYSLLWKRRWGWIGSLQSYNFQGLHF